MCKQNQGKSKKYQTIYNVNGIIQLPRSQSYQNKMVANVHVIGRNYMGERFVID
jgi:hypothetical protein